jgi:hypothetical protein
MYEMSAATPTKRFRKETKGKRQALWWWFALAMADREHRTSRAPQKDLTAAQRVASAAALALGRGFDVTCDFRLHFIKGPQQLVKTNEDKYNVRIPGDIIIPNVSCDIKCIKGERMHFKSEILPFVQVLDTIDTMTNFFLLLSCGGSAHSNVHCTSLICDCWSAYLQMSARFNEGAAIHGKVPLGLFNSMYGFHGHWQTDQQSTKGLALDGWFISLYSLQLTSTALTLCDEIKQAVPPSWEPRALARSGVSSLPLFQWQITEWNTSPTNLPFLNLRWKICWLLKFVWISEFQETEVMWLVCCSASFIEKYGTHIITSVKIGGKDVIYARQHQSSSASIIQVQKIIQTMADKSFLGHTNDQNSKENIWKEKVGLCKPQVAHQ